MKKKINKYIKIEKISKRRNLSAEKETLGVDRSIKRDREKCFKLKHTDFNASKYVRA